MRVAALAIGGLLQGLPLPDAIQPPLREILARMLRVYVDVFVQLDLEVGWSSDGQVLGIFEKPKPAFNCHPQSGEPTFFSGIHSQSSILQARREGERFRGVAATDVFWGDGEICGSDAEIEVSLLEHVDEVIRRCTRRVLMEPGDKKNEKRELISDIWGKRGATYGEKGGCRVGGVFFSSTRIVSSTDATHSLARGSTESSGSPVPHLVEMIS